MDAVGATIFAGVATIIIGIGSIIANIWITRYNMGKNRLIYDIERIISSGDHKNREEEEKIRPKLKSGEYTVLNIFQDAGNSRNTVYILGKIKES